MRINYNTMLSIQLNFYFKDHKFDFMLLNHILMPLFYKILNASTKNSLGRKMKSYTKKGVCLRFVIFFVRLLLVYFFVKLKFVKYAKVQ